MTKAIGLGDGRGEFAGRFPICISSTLPLMGVLEAISYFQNTNYEKTEYFQWIASVFLGISPNQQ